MKLTDQDIHELAGINNIEYAALKAFIQVESGGTGFDKNTGKIIIQFEPHWFKKKAPHASAGEWSLNKVERQSREWIAFNDAFSKNAVAAMESTSIGLMQVMGFNHKVVGFNSVGDMWDFAKVSEKNQVELGIRFIKANPTLYKALKEKNWHLVAYYYNGSAYKEMAKKWGREPYNISLQKAYAAALKKDTLGSNIKLTTSNLHLRINPALNMKIIKTLPKGTAVKIIWEGDGWAEVIADGTKGWVSSSYIK